MGRPTRRHDPRGTVVAYAYGESGQRAELTVEGQGTVYYQYDELGRMSSVLDGKTGLATTYEYDPAGRLRLQAHPNGSTSYFAYDAAGRNKSRAIRIGGSSRWVSHSNRSMEYGDQGISMICTRDVLPGPGIDAPWRLGCMRRRPLLVGGDGDEAPRFHVLGSSVACYELRDVPE